MVVVPWVVEWHVQGVKIKHLVSLRRKEDALNNYCFLLKMGGHDDWIFEPHTPFLQASQADLCWPQTPRLTVFPSRMGERGISIQL